MKCGVKLISCFFLNVARAMWGGGGGCQYARTHTINVILTSYKGNTGQVFAGIALVLGQYYILTEAGNY